MDNLNVFDIIPLLCKNQNEEAVSKYGKIKWVERKLSAIDSIKELKFINNDGGQWNLLTDTLLEQINHNVWLVK